jgi:hypothetical protein
MGKDTFYFSHDYNARADNKIKQMIRIHGMLGYGVFWSIVEDLYNNANALHLDYKGIAYDLRVDEKIIKSVINDFDLFSIEKEIFGSCSVERRLEERNKKSETARQTAFKRWNKNKENAKALPMQYEGNAIKERKGKERKKEEQSLPTKSSPKKPTPIERNFEYLPIAKKLSKIVQEKKQITHTKNQIHHWANDIRQLVENNEVSIERINIGLEYLKLHAGEQYCPVIESGSALREKFSSLEGQIKSFNTFKRKTESEKIIRDGEEWFLQSDGKYRNTEGVLYRD